MATHHLLRIDLLPKESAEADLVSGARTTRTTKMTRNRSIRSRQMTPRIGWPVHIFSGIWTPLGLTCLAGDLGLTGHRV